MITTRVEGEVRGGPEQRRKCPVGMWPDLVVRIQEVSRGILNGSLREMRGSDG